MIVKIATTIDRQEHSHESEGRCTSTLAEYLAFAKAHPEQFVNPSEGGFTILQGENEIHEVEVFMAQKLQAKGLSGEATARKVLIEEIRACCVS